MICQIPHCIDHLSNLISVSITIRKIKCNIDQIFWSHFDLYQRSPFESHHICRTIRRGLKCSRNKIHVYCCWAEMWFCAKSLHGLTCTGRSTGDPKWGLFLFIFFHFASKLTWRNLFKCWEVGSMAERIEQRAHLLLNVKKPADQRRTFRLIPGAAGPRRKVDTFGNVFQAKRAGKTMTMFPFLNYIVLSTCVI